jgi:hypothetical protein
MDTKYSLINSAQAAYDQHRGVAKHFEQIAESLKTDTTKLMEDVSGVLQALRGQLDQGKPITSMSPETAAAFLAGVDFITKTLPNVKEKQNVEKVLRILNNVAMGSDGKITAGAAELIARLAQNNSQVHQQLKGALASYGQAPKPNKELSGMVGKLRIAIERAQQLAQHSANQATPQATAGQAQAPAQAPARPAAAQINRPKPPAPGV